ncbi:origin recognition complex subunit 2-like [Penaeus chinensis]|uniref:origin recognition complex subunit 2-like n=1 Tax=Penaeus chinensis TaxID=139456 RepID=UPI001FB841CB|nr:origin recognition complex subunit 2-like [Penaeus chinensis]
MERRRSKRFLSVTFVDDNEVEKVKIGVEGGQVVVRPLSQRGRTRGSRVASAPNVELPPLEEINEEDEDVFFKPTELLEDGEASVKASDVFGFRTPRKKGSMLEKAESTKKLLQTPTTPKTPRSALKQGSRTPRTPKTPLSASKRGSRTPSSKRRLSVSLQEPNTPYSFRKRVTQRIKKIVCEEDSSSSEEENDCDSNYYSSEDSEDEGKENFDLNENMVQSQAKTPRNTPLKQNQALSKTPGRTPSRTPSRGRRAGKIKDVELTATADEYFMSHGETTKVVTSDHTLSRLETPRLSAEALQALLMGISSSHHQERQALLEEHLQMFPRWMTYLCEGFSIFLYGLGSKKMLISQFQEQYLMDFDHIVDKASSNTYTKKNILNNITEDIMEHKGSFHSAQEQIGFIQNYYAKADADPLFIIIHNLDGPMLRGEKTQAAISQLATAPKIHLLASIDHINAPLVFDGSKMSCYNALWCDGTTLGPYSEETSYENSLLVQQSGALALSSLIHVFKSLTPNAKGIFLLLARHQLQQKDNSNYGGLSFNDMYQRCREAFLVNSDLTLRAQLTEFRDHKLIKSKKGLDGVENLLIPLDPATLQEFVNQQEADGL